VTGSSASHAGPALSPPSGEGPAARTERVSEWLGERSLDALLVTHPVNVRYLTGFTGSNGLAVVGEPGLGLRLFLTDFRYLTQAAEQVDATYEREAASNDLLEGLGPRLLPERVGRPGLRLGFDDAHVSVKVYERLRGLLGSAVELVGAGGLVERMRAVKEPGEVERIRAAAALADEILGWLVDRPVVGLTERAVAIELEHEMRLRGATAPSFPSIVAAGEHSALPHAEPRDVAIPPNTLVTVDMGALLDGYCSDVTRTFATGRLDGEERAVYDLVLEAQLTGLGALRPGPTGREVDTAAREVIVAAGHGEHYGHGLGHGVGLEVHEAPRLSQTGATTALEEGHVVTVEPGVYLPGRFGVRIEDLTVLVAEGHEVLSTFTKDLIELS
jgi:Xaa-Pro aminopeptidase